MRYFLNSLVLLTAAWIVLARPSLPNQAVSAQALSSSVVFEDEGFVTLFDGQTLQGWTGSTESHRVEDGAITVVAGSAGNLLTEKEYSDFVLRFEFRLTEGANNGLGVRCPKVAKGNLHLEGIELQILDNSAMKYKDLQPYQYHGSVYGVVPARKDFLKPVGAWNQQEVTVKERRIKVRLNGGVIVDADLDAASTPKTLDGQDHPGLKRIRGHIGFLGHGDRVDFRNVRIKDLSK